MLIYKLRNRILKSINSVNFNMKNIYFTLLIVLVFKIDCFSQDTLSFTKNKRIVYEYIINDFKKLSLDKDEVFIVNIDFEQDIPTEATVGLINKILKVESINYPIKFEMDNVLFYENLSYDCVYQTATKYPFMDKLYFLDIKIPLDKWLNLNEAELSVLKNNDEIKIYIPIIYKSFDFEAHSTNDVNFIYEFIYHDGTIKFSKKVAF